MRTFLRACKKRSSPSPSESPAPLVLSMKAHRLGCLRLQCVPKYETPAEREASRKATVLTSLLKCYDQHGRIRVERWREEDLKQKQVVALLRSEEAEKRSQDLGRAKRISRDLVLAASRSIDDVEEAGRGNGSFAEQD